MFLFLIVNLISNYKIFFFQTSTTQHKIHKSIIHPFGSNSNMIRHIVVMCQSAVGTLLGQNISFGLDRIRTHLHLNFREPDKMMSHKAYKYQKGKLYV